MSGEHHGAPRVGGGAEEREHEVGQRGEGGELGREGHERFQRRLVAHRRPQRHAAAADRPAKQLLARVGSD